MSHFANEFAILAARIALAFVYLYAAYLNAKVKNRDWLLSHTALLYPSNTPPFLVACSAFVGVAMMFAGGFLVLVGLATRFGCFVLIVFTLLGYWQHSKEVQFATKTADALSAEVEALISGAANIDIVRGHLLNLRISAEFGQLSSGLKNWGLIGAFVLLASVGAGTVAIDNYL